MSGFTYQTPPKPRRPAPRIEEPSQPWTTARCHRLLRPIVSRIASLRKESALSAHNIAPASILTSGTTAISPANGSQRHDETDAEAGWLMPRKKRPRLTYSQRRGARQTQSQSAGQEQSSVEQANNSGDLNSAKETTAAVKRTLKCFRPEGQRRAAAPGEIVAPTPLLRRARGQIASSPEAPGHEPDSGSGHNRSDYEHRTKAVSRTQKDLDGRMARLREHMPSKYADLEAVYRSFEALLKATAPPTQDLGIIRGPRPFLDMCLRKVPQCITELEAWERWEAEQSGTISTLDGVDMSAQIYNELESLGTNIGWRHLRVVVRADGLNALREGIEDGIFGDEFSQLLIDLCVQAGANLEAAGLVTALIRRQYPQPSSTESCFAHAIAFQPLENLNTFANRTQQTSFLFQQCSLLLSSGKLPQDWLVTSEFERIWSLAAQRLANVRPNYEAVTFMIESISLLCNRKRTFTGSLDTNRLEQDIVKASQRTLMSALAILVSMGLLGESEPQSPCSEDPDIQRITLIGDRLRYVIRACITGLEGKRGRNNQRLESLYLALFLSSSYSQGKDVEAHVKGSLESLLSSLDASMSVKNIRMRSHYDSITWLISSIARSCGRGTSVASHQCLDGLFKRLERLGLDHHQLGGLKAAAAFLLAQQTNNVRDLIYAENLNPHARSSFGGTIHQQSDIIFFTGYRWEETIGEWVTVSPILNKRQAPAIKKHLRSFTSGTDTSNFPTGSASLNSPVTGGVPDAERSSGQGTDDSELCANESPRRACVGQALMMKKRPRRIHSNETLTTKLEAEVRPSKQSLAKRASSGLQGSELDPEKENRVRLLAKKPRRSSGRIVLGTRPRSSLATGRGGENGRDGVYSDDELCV
ncbi:hypothetical protein F5Y19DRAFT_410260 [Xylariaceae sp. FL1651]|nr:hypothetical protein F5Y19DRAFT_410260 [Xylariaceae sp. FL1651]